MNPLKYICLALVIPLSGCFYQSVSNVDIRRAVQYCGSVDNVVEISAQFIGEEWVYCDNKHRTNLDKVFLENK